MTKDEIEKLAKEYCHQYLNDAFRIEPYFSKATDDNEYIITQSFKAGYLKGVEAEKLNYKNSIEHEMAVVRTEYLKVITALVDDSSKLEKQLAIAKEALENLVKSEVVRSAQYITYSEAYLNAQECLDKIAAMQSEGEK